MAQARVEMEAAEEVVRGVEMVEEGKRTVRTAGEKDLSSSSSHSELD